MRKCVAVKQSRSPTYCMKSKRDFTSLKCNGSSCLDIHLKLWFLHTGL